jgi:hypothetical protein
MVLAILGLRVRARFRIATTVLLILLLILLVFRFDVLNLLRLYRRGRGLRFSLWQYGDDLLDSRLDHIIGDLLAQFFLPLAHLPFAGGFPLGLLFDDVFVL